MERLRLYTSATRRGPFWTLILRIVSGKTSQTAPALPCEPSRQAGASMPFAQPREFQAVCGPVSQAGGTSEAYPLPAPSTYLGPFMTLILSMHKHGRERKALTYPAAPLRVGFTG